MIASMEMDLVPRTYECGRDGRMRAHDLMKHLQEIASDHAEKMDLGLRWMMMSGYIWVLVDMKLGIERMPKWNERCTMYTMPSGFDDMKAYREFIVQGAKDEELIKASSVWMVLDLRKKTPVSTKDLGFGFPRNGKRNYPDIKRTSSDGKGKKVHSLVVAESSIDLNGHVNNTEFIRWSMDALSMTMDPPKMIKGLQAGYKAEVFKGERLDLYLDENNEWTQIECFKRGEDKAVFIMEVHTG